MSFKTQKIATGNKTAVVVSAYDYRSMIFTNTHATDAVTIDLYAISQTSADITNTGTDVNLGDGYAATTSSQAVVLSATAATSDAFLNERVYKSDGILFGICTTFTDGTHITFAAGLENAMTDADLLYTGTRYHFLNNVVIPNGTSLKLENDEFSIDTNNYGLYIDSSDSSGNIDIITRY